MNQAQESPVHRLSVYIAAPYAAAEFVRSVHHRLRAAGVECTSRWAEQAVDPVGAIKKDKSIETEADVRRAFAMDREDIARADALLALLDLSGVSIVYANLPSMNASRVQYPPPRETYCEVEFARASGKSIVYVGGPPLSLLVADYDGQARRAVDVDHAIRLLAEMAAASAALAPSVAAL